MAMVRVEATIEVPAQAAWEAIADVGAVHERLLPGRVTSARLDGGVRILTMPDGSEIRELIISIDHEHRRLAYAVVEGQKLSLTYHHAAFEVYAEGERCRLVWSTDLLPDGLAEAVRARTERGIVEIKQNLEAHPDSITGRS